MSHQRTVIRDAVCSALALATTVDDVTTYPTDAGARVFKSRTGPLRAAELPAICVLSGDEQIDPTSRNTAPRELERNYRLRIQMFVRLTEDVEADLDALLLQVERVMHADPTFANTAPRTGDSLLVGVSEPEMPDQGNRPLGAFEAIYEFSYHTLAPDPDDIGELDNFNTFDAKTSLSNEQDEDDQSEVYVTDLNPPEE